MNLSIKILLTKWQALITMLILLLITQKANASEEIASVTANDNTFTITRADKIGQATIYYRTINGSAVEDIHFKNTSGVLYFADGELSKEIVVPEFPESEISTIDKFQTNKREYQFEVWNDYTSPLIANRTIAYNKKYTISTDLYSKEIYLDKTSDNSTFQGVFGYTNGNRVYSIDEVTAKYSDEEIQYLNLSGEYSYLVRAEFRLWEDNFNGLNDCNQYFGIAGDTFEDPSAGNGKAAEPKNNFMNISIAHNPNEWCKDKCYYNIPVRNAGEGSLNISNAWNSKDYWDLDNSQGYLNEQRFRKGAATNDYKYVALPSSTETYTLVSNIECLNSPICAFTYDKVKFHFALQDKIKPNATKLYINTSQPYVGGDQVTIAVRFSEIVFAQSNVRLLTSRGTFDYIGGSGTNILYFKGTIERVSLYDKGIAVLQIENIITDLSGNELEQSFTLINNDIELARKFNIAYQLENGTINGNNIKSYIYKNGAFLPNDVTRDNYEFGGWFDNINYEGEPISQIFADEQGDKIFYARWIPKKYNINFVLNGGEIVNNTIDSYDFGSTINLPTNVVRQHFEFDGWYDDNNNKVASISQNDAGDKTFYAHWKARQYTLTIDFDNTMGSVVGNGKYETGSVQLSAQPFDNYEFLGWSNGISANTFSMKIVSDTTIAAYFGEKETIVLKKDFDIETLNIGEKLEPIDLYQYIAGSRNSRIFFTVASSNPNVIFAQVKDNFLYLTVSNYVGQSEISITATLANGNTLTIAPKINVEKLCSIDVEIVKHDASCFGFYDGAIEIINNSDNEYSYQWNDVSENINQRIFLQKNDYSVTISDNDGCSTTKTISIDEPDEMILELVNFADPSCDNNNGYISMKSNGDYIYAWNNGASSLSIDHCSAGNYDLIATNPINGCTASFGKLLNKHLSFDLHIDSTRQSFCNQNTGAIFVNEISDANYLWSNGATSQNLENVGAGEYSLTVTDQNNCTETITFSIEIPSIETPEITIVSVAQHATNNIYPNEIVWNNDNNQAIDHYNIYREISDDFVLIGSTDNPQTNSFVDASIDGATMAYSYKISAADACNNESQLSQPHTTIHLQKPEMIDNQIHLNWSDYVGCNYESYIIFKEMETENGVAFEKLDEIPSYQTQYIDTNLQIGRNKYCIAITYFDNNEQTNLVFSNMNEIEILPSKVSENNTSDWHIENQTVVFDRRTSSTIRVFDLLGRQIYSGCASQIDLPKGVYEILIDNQTFRFQIR